VAQVGRDAWDEDAALCGFAFGDPDTEFTWQLGFTADGRPA